MELSISNSIRFPSIIAFICLLESIHYISLAPKASNIDLNGTKTLESISRGLIAVSIGLPSINSLIWLSAWAFCGLKASINDKNNTNIIGFLKKFLLTLVILFYF